MRYRKTMAAIAATAAAGAAFVALPASPALAATPLPVPRVVTDGQHVFVSDGSRLSSVEVFDREGNRVGTITGQDTAAGMALSQDGGTLYIAHSGATATISAIDTTTLQQTASYSVHAGVTYLALEGNRLWYGYASGGSVGIGAVDVAGGSGSVAPQSLASSYSAAPHVLADPADPDTLVIAGDGGSGALAVYDVSSGTPVRQAVNTQESVITDAAVTADGKDVLVVGSTDRSLIPFAIPSLGYDAGGFATYDDPVSVAVASDGSVATGAYPGTPTSQDGVSVFGPNDLTPWNTFAPQVEAGGLAWSPDATRLYAVSGGQTTDPVLHVFDIPTVGDNVMSLAPPSTAEVGVPYTVSGRMTSSAPFAAGQRVHVTRYDENNDDGGDPLPDAAVNADGTFSFTDTMESAQDAYGYLVTYTGDADHRTAQQWLEPLKATDPSSAAATTLWLQFEDRAKVGKKLKMDGRLTSDTAVPAGSVVTITREDATGPGTALVGTRKVAADGTFQIADVPLVAGPAVYTVTYAGDATHSGSTTSATAQVAP